VSNNVTSEVDNVPSEFELSERQYTAALSAFNSGRYEEAASLFEAVPNYFDSNEMAQTAR
jgi:TolA-binding protein